MLMQQILSRCGVHCGVKQTRIPQSPDAVAEYERTMPIFFFMLGL